MRWASAGSDSPDLGESLDSIVAALRERLGNEPPDLAVGFVSGHFAPMYASLPGMIAEKLGPRLLVGCSAGGVIGGGREIERRPGVSVTAAHLPGVTLTERRVEARDLPDLDAAPGAWRDLVGAPSEPPPHFLVIADPFSFPAHVLLAGLDYAYPRSVKIGGLASGARGPGGNAIYLQGHIFRDGATVVALSGDVEVSAIVAQGCRPIGGTMRVTACRGNLLLGVDGRPPLETLRALMPSLPERDRRLLSHSLFLGIAMDELVEEPGAGEFLIRNIIGMDPEAGALAIGENLRVGRTVRFHLRDAASSAEDLTTVLDRFVGGGGADEAAGALLFSCLGRGVHLYGTPDHDTNLFRKHLGDLPLGGFFCNGEIGPVGGATYIHGYTSAFGVFRPARA